MKIINTILFMAFILCTVSYSFAEADYPALTKNSRSRSSLTATAVKEESEDEVEKDTLTKYYLSSPTAKPKTRKYSLTGDPIYEDPSILRKNREKATSKDSKNNLIADPIKISKREKSYSKSYKRKEYNYDFLYEQKPIEDETDSLKLTL